MLVVGLGLWFGVFLVTGENSKKWQTVDEIWFFLVILFIAGFAGWGALGIILGDWMGVAKGFRGWLYDGWGILILSAMPPIYYCFKTKA
jgi:hypothetical protein